VPALAFALAVAPPCGAQNETTTDEPLATIPVPQPADAPPAEDEPVQLDEVVVTAQKVKQPLRRVPISVTALGGDFIADTGAADLADVSLYVPNVRVDADDLGSPQVFIRGFGTNSFNPSFEAAVAFVQDDLYFGRPGYFTEAMFDIDRVEVLRGPQGTLFGKNSVAGVFNVTSRGPEQAVSGDARLFGGEDGEQRFEGGIGGLFTDWFGGRIAAQYRTQDGELRNQFLNRLEEELEQTSARVKAVFYPGFGLRSELTAVDSQTQAPFWPFQLMVLDDDTRDYLDDFDPAIEDDPKNFVTSFDTPGWIEKGSTTFGLKNEWELGELGPLTDFVPVLVIGTSKFFIDQLNELDVSPADISRLDNHEDHQQVSAELRFSGRFGSLFGLGTGLEFVAGGFYYDSSYTLLARVLAGRDLDSYVTTDDFQQLASGDNGAGSGLGSGGLGSPAGATLADGDYYQFDYVQDIESTALFGQVTWFLTDHWGITPGVRINHEKKRVDSAGNGFCQGKPATPCFMQSLLEAQDYSYRDLRRDENDVSPKLAIQYFGDAVNYYASYARGFKSGGFNSISLTGQNLEYFPEKARTVEAGVKGRSPEGTFSMNVTVYATHFDNLQVLAFNGLLYDVSNAAQARSRGWEADFQWITPYEPFRLMGSLGLVTAYYLSYPGAPAPISQGIGAQQDLGGRRIAFTPRRSATLTPMLTYLIGDYLATVAADVLYQGDQYTDTDLDPNTYQPSYWKYAARATLGPAGGLWSVSLGGTNLSDERVLNQVTDAPFFPGTFFAQQASGRQLFGVVTLRY
jgi:outer membrane receptor protein involved in Fe transport